MVDTICFHERMLNYPYARVQRVRPRYSASGRCDSIKLVDIIPREADETEFLICSPTVLGFCLSKQAIPSVFLPLQGDVAANGFFSRVCCGQYQRY